MQAINAALIDTLAACGDVNRNVAVAANPLQSRAHAAVHAQAAALSEHLLPNTRAYYEIWLDEEKRRRQRRGGRADLRRHLPAAQVQDRLRDAAATTTSTCSRRTWASSRSSMTTARCSATTSRVGGGMGATHGDAGNLSAPGAT